MVVANEVVQLPERKSDAEIAHSLRERMQASLQAVAALHQEATSHGMRIEAHIAPNAFGVWAVHYVHVLKLVG